MELRRLVTVAFLAAAVLVGAAIGARGSDLHRPIEVRWCPEDAVHVGVGSFNGARWTAYRCVARDDLR